MRRSHLLKSALAKLEIELAQMKAKTAPAKR
jgi:hypothetical protein